jgi:glycerophosphoryl diester phosphodiesterase
MLASLPRPVVFAHRGSSKDAPENTMAAFRLAIDQKADAIELDVQLSADKEVVVFHDHTIDRTTNGEGYVKDYDFRTLRKLSAGILFGNRYVGEKIPSLSHVFEDLGNSIFYNIELKNLITPFDDLPNRVVELVHRFNLKDRILISSFNPIALHKVSKASQEISKGILVKRDLPLSNLLFRLFSNLNYQSVHFSYDMISQKRVQTIHSSGKLAFTYTLNNPADIITSMKDGVDGFFTDDPALARKIILKGRKNQNRLVHY